jgi:hypothetical protein
MGVKNSFFIRSDGLAELVGDRVIVFKPKPFFEKEGKEDSISHAETWQEIYDCLKKYGCDPVFKEKESQITKVELNCYALYTLDQILDSYAFVQQIEDFLIGYSFWSDRKCHTLFFRFNEIWSVKLFSTSDISKIIDFAEASLPPFWTHDRDKLRITRIIVGKTQKLNVLLKKS